MSPIRKTLLTVMTVGTLGVTAALGVFSAFSATTTNTDNAVTAGSVAISDSDGGSTPLYTQSGMAPGESVVKCIRVTYTGSLAATVKLYVSAGITNGSVFNLKVERGSGTSGAFPACTGFTAAATLYDGQLGSFGTDWTTGIDARGSAWSQSDAVDYRFTVTVNEDTTPNGHTATASSGTHTFTWEAHNN